MISYDVAIVEDRGTYWEIMGVSKNSFATLDNNSHYLKLSHAAAQIIKDNLVGGNNMRVKKPLRVDEVMPNEIDVIQNDVNELEYFKSAQIKRVRMIVTPEIVSLSGLTYYTFTCLNNELADKGFFITDANRESKYLSILETGDEALINKLEEYLNCRDDISRVSSLYKNFETLRKKINEESDKEKITTLVDNFMSTYYSRF